MNRTKSLLFTLVLLLSVLAYSNYSLKNKRLQAEILEASLQAQQLSDYSKSFLALLTVQNSEQEQLILADIVNNWDVRFVPMALEVLLYSPRRSEVHDVLLAQILKNVTKDPVNDNNPEGSTVQDFYYWLWNQDIKPVGTYSEFKADLYKNIDKKFETYFRGRQDSARIRLDEIRWGGVGQDGIPPLRNPEMLSADDADYLEDNNIVFGIEINGDARAYPKRILAWHEMFTDSIGGVDIAGVYCTLCGTVIPYKTQHKGTKYNLGTSGFLYRSNKLMYDQATQSLWSTSKGIPVVGPLVDQGIELEFESVVTTTWGEWKKRHPKTSVLSLETGHTRDYGEGIAYADYFGTDQIMFNTPFQDKRLKNKREILAIRFVAAPDQQLAIDTEFLNKNTLYKNKIGVQGFIVLTDKTGANRVYDPKDIDFVTYDQDQSLKDSKGQTWTQYEDHLLAADGTRLERLPYHRAFWFGWRAAYPETKLIK